ncbi:MAG: PilZ domain-containing protein [Acidobacteriota bacterium]
MVLSLYQVVLPVSDIDQAEKFYSHLLGTPGRRVSPGQHHFECGGVILNCNDSSAEGVASQTSSSPHRLYFVVEDIEAVFERAQSGGCASVDEQILSQPWGERSFLAEDPFKNSLGFVDETTAIQQAGEQSAAGPDDCLKTGCALSIRSITGESDGQLAAAVTKIFSEEVWLKLAEPPPAHFKPGEKVKIQFGDGEAVFFSETEIVKCSPTETQYVAISIPEKLQAFKKRAIPRIQSKVPVSISVVSATEDQLVSAAPFDSKTHDISTAGLRFDTTLPLKKGDELELKLLLSPEQEITVNAKVMGTKKVKRSGEAVTLVGTQFVEIQLDDQIKLLQFLIDAEESGKQDSKDVPSQPEEPKAAPVGAPKAPPAAPAPPKGEQESKAAPVARKPKDEEPKAALTETPGAPEPPPAVQVPEVPPAAPEAPEAPETPSGAPVAMKFKEEEPKAAPPVPEVPSAAQAVPAAPQAPAPASTHSAEPTAAPAAVKTQGAQEPTQPKELSWFAAQMNKTEETEKSGGVKAAVPQQAHKPAEKPSMPIVQVSPSVQSGKAFLELSNGYHQPVTVKDVFAAKGAGSLTPLLTEPKHLSPGETQRLDVTEPLLPLFQQENAEVQDQLLHILFTLEPEPPDQPAPSRSLLRFDKGGFTEFSLK